tara:strand:- start:12283 stop:13008 length:726 start_codon:yes stop_codon:yes gene_type:complete
MAGGLGKRMCSDLPKVLHLLDNKPMLVRVLENSLLLKPKKILVVVGKYKSIISSTISNYISLENIEFVNQPEAKGTGDAIKCCRNTLLSYKNHKVLILSGDVPLVSLDTMMNTITNLKKCKIVVTQVDNPQGLGRIYLENNKFIKIIEDKDCNEEQKKIDLINTGIYSFNSDILCKYLPLIYNNNAQKEYYLTDIIEIIKLNENIDIDMYKINKDKQYELTGVNTKQQLLELNTFFKNKFN